MNIHRFDRCAALIAVTCAAALSLAACSAGITSTSQAAPSPSQTPSRSATASPAASGSTVSVGGSLGSFPIPAHAKVVENITDGGQTIIILGSVSPSEVSGFYASALPRAGYKITMNTLATMNNNTGAAIEFTGHGYKGTISAESNIATTGVSVGGLNGKNFVGITLTKH